MARFTNAAVNAFSTGYDMAASRGANPKKDKNQQTAYQRYVEKYYGPGVTSHTDPIALARAATGAVEQGLKSGAGYAAGFLGHAAAGLLGAPMGSSSAGGRATTNTGGGIGSDAAAAGRGTPSNRLYGNSAIGAGLGSAGGSGSGYGSFNDIGSRISGDLQRDFGLSANQAAGIVGNLGHESGGFTQYQERNPTKGRGGAGWAQWTGDRRVAFENYTQQHNLHPQSYEANYGFLKQELSGKYQGAISAVKKANTVQDAVYKFEQTYEKANPKYVNYASRVKYANNLTAPDTALAYTSTDTPLTPAQRAAAGQAAGRAGTISRRGSDVAAMQRDLNSRGAKLTVDGLEGPLTRQAEQQYYGSPTSVRTPSFTTPKAPYTSGAQDEGRVPAAGTARTANVRQDYVSTPGFTNRQSYTSGRGDEGQVPRAGVASTPYLNQPYTPAPATPRTPYLNNPYTGSTGGSINPNVRSVPTIAIRSDVAHQSPLPGYYNDQTASGMTTTGGRAVPTTGGYAPTTAPVLTGGFSRAPVPQTPYLNQPYTMTTGGANAIVAPVQTARIPRARPDQPPQQAVPTAGTGLSLETLQAMAEKYGIPVTRVAQVARDVGSRAESAFREGVSRNAGNSYSGGNYSGGTYGGAGGRSISSGVGGAFKNR